MLDERVDARRVVEADRLADRSGDLERFADLRPTFRAQFVEDLLVAPLPSCLGFGLGAGEQESVIEAGFIAELQHERRRDTHPFRGDRLVEGDGSDQ